MEKTSKLEVGAVKIHKDVIASIAGIAASEIEGVEQIGKRKNFSIMELLGLKSLSRGIRVEFGKNDEIFLEVPLTIKYGYNISEVAESAREGIRQALEKMIDKTPRDIRISVQAIENRGCKGDKNGRSEY